MFPWSYNSHYINYKDYCIDLLKVFPFKDSFMFIICIDKIKCTVFSNNNKAQVAVIFKYLHSKWNYFTFLANDAHTTVPLFKYYPVRNTEIMRKSFYWISYRSSFPYNSPNCVTKKPIPIDNWAHQRRGCLANDVGFTKFKRMWLLPCSDDKY